MGTVLDTGVCCYCDEEEIMHNDRRQSEQVSQAGGNISGIINNQSKNNFNTYLLYLLCSHLVLQLSYPRIPFT